MNHVEEQLALIERDLAECPASQVLLSVGSASDVILEVRRFMDECDLKSPGTNWTAAYTKLASIQRLCIQRLSIATTPSAVSEAVAKLTLAVSGIIPMDFRGNANAFKRTVFDDTWSSSWLEICRRHEVAAGRFFTDLGTLRELYNGVLFALLSGPQYLTANGFDFADFCEGSLQCLQLMRDSIASFDQSCASEADEGAGENALAPRDSLEACTLTFVEDDETMRILSRSSRFLTTLSFLVLMSLRPLYHGKLPASSSAPPTPIPQSDIGGSQLKSHPSTCQPVSSGFRPVTVRSTAEMAFDLANRVMSLIHDNSKFLPSAYGAANGLLLFDAMYSSWKSSGVSKEVCGPFLPGSRKTRQLPDLFPMDPPQEVIARALEVASRNMVESVEFATTPPTSDSSVWLKSVVNIVGMSDIPQNGASASFTSPDVARYEDYLKDSIDGLCVDDESLGSRRELFVNKLSEHPDYWTTLWQYQSVSLWSKLASI